MSEIPRKVVARWDIALRGLSWLWTNYGSKALHEAVTAELQAEHPEFDLRVGADYDLSLELAADSKPGAWCYWNAGRAVLKGEGLTYCEGLVIVAGASRVRDGQMRRGGLLFDWQGWVEAADGRRADPTLLLNLDRGMPADAVRERLGSASYFTMMTAERDEVGDRWDSLPLTLTSAAVTEATLEAMVPAFSKYMMAARRGEQARKGKIVSHVGAFIQKPRWCPPVGRSRR